MSERDESDRAAGQRRQNVRAVDITGDARTGTGRPGDRADCTNVLAGKPADLVKLVDPMSIAMPPLCARNCADGGSSSH